MAHALHHPSASPCGCIDAAHDATTAGTTAILLTLQMWGQRRRQRTALGDLDEHLLSDIGMTREQARCEAAKPFWA